MKGTNLAASVAMAVAVTILAGPALADDYDAPFNAQLHSYGIYGSQDFNAWLGKIACQRLAKGVDGDVDKSVTFIQRNLSLHTTEGQSLQFLGTAINHYCPNQIGLLQRADVS
ncbi:DUF732 domain-containing protein [Mycobacterium lepromatosis]|uniref:DUF732 domain-containing protein n=1 Tax=Mycobacterium lepromatosis TaxID=480418 RepID=A0A0F4EP96_9MYCO|nr:DUF732 domain-containing protein [Mycobacterium lepromatosis]KJX74703.1 hypothetical protein MLPM_2274 [Mycobacterium lepromatosis]UKN42791.1 hypothetical protein MLPF_2574 [Mycobacterium lepromatosis]